MGRHRTTNNRIRYSSFGTIRWTLRYIKAPNLNLNGLHDKIKKISVSTKKRNRIEKFLLCTRLQANRIRYSSGIAHSQFYFWMSDNLTNFEMESPSRIHTTTTTTTNIDHYSIAFLWRGEILLLSEYPHRHTTNMWI